MSSADDKAGGDAAGQVAYHKRCHDCGKFVSRDRWVRKDDPRKAHALCWECYCNYDDPIFG